MCGNVNLKRDKNKVQLISIRIKYGELCVET